MLRPNLARAPLGVGAFAVRPVSGADTSSTAVRSLCLALFARVGNAAGRQLGSRCQIHLGAGLQLRRRLRLPSSRTAVGCGAVPFRLIVRARSAKTRARAPVRAPSAHQFLCSVARSASVRLRPIQCIRSGQEHSSMLQLSQQEQGGAASTDRAAIDRVASGAASDVARPTRAAKCGPCTRVQACSVSACSLPAHAAEQHVREPAIDFLPVFQATRSVCMCQRQSNTRCHA